MGNSPNPSSCLAASQRTWVFLCSCADETVESRVFRTDKVTLGLTPLHRLSMHVLYYYFLPVKKHSNLPYQHITVSTLVPTGLGCLPDQQSVNSSVCKTVIV
jgi:hypothetical protein